MRAFLSLSSLAITTLLLVLPQIAQAQMNNQPFAFQRNAGTTAGNVGMSPTYRKIVLERKLLGRSTANNFIRGADGSLINIERTGDQAFAQPAKAPYDVARTRLSLNGGGYAAEVGGGLTRVGWRAEASHKDMPALLGLPAGGVPINSWIHELSTLPDIAP